MQECIFIFFTARHRSQNRILQRCHQQKLTWNRTYRHVDTDHILFLRASNKTGKPVVPTEWNKLVKKMHLFSICFCVFSSRIFSSRWRCAKYSIYFFCPYFHKISLIYHMKYGEWMLMTWIKLSYLFHRVSDNRQQSCVEPVT